MLLPQLSAAFALVALAQGAAVPAASSGLYTFKGDSELVARGLPFKHGQIWCGCGRVESIVIESAAPAHRIRFSLNHYNIDAAVALLKTPAFRQIAPNASYLRYSGSGGAQVVGFACNYSPNTIKDVTADNFTEWFTEITNACGAYTAGAIEWGDPGQRMIIGYQRYNNGDDVCALATLSGSNRY